MKPLILSEMRKLKVEIAKIMFPHFREKVSKSERFATMIALQLMKMPDTELLIHPSMEKLYIHTKDDQFLIVIYSGQGTVTLSNHRYQYDVKFSRRAMNFLSDKFMETTEFRRDHFEEKFLENTEMSLKNIYDTTKAMLPYAE